MSVALSQAGFVFTDVQAGTIALSDVKLGFTASEVQELITAAAVGVISSLADKVVSLSMKLGVTQGAISQHLKSLKLAGLVAERAEGRNVYYRVQPEGLTPLVDWMSHYGVFWRERFTNLRTLLKEIDP